MQTYFKDYHFHGIAPTRVAYSNMGHYVQVSPKDTARMLRKQLKVVYPEVSFKVGIKNESIYVYWTGGPEAACVFDWASKYYDNGLKFDGEQLYYEYPIIEDGKYKDAYLILCIDGIRLVRT